MDTHTHTYTHTHIYILFQIVFPYRLSHNIEYSYLCDTVSPLGYLFYIQYCVYVNSSLINEKHEDLVAYFHDSSSISGDTNVWRSSEATSSSQSKFWNTSTQTSPILGYFHKAGIHGLRLPQPLPKCQINSLRICCSEYQHLPETDRNCASEDRPSLPKTIFLFLLTSSKKKKKKRYLQKIGSVSEDFPWRKSRDTSLRPLTSNCVFIKYRPPKKY